MDGLALPIDNREGPNCGVTCVAIVAGVSFAEAWAYFASRSTLRKRWRGQTTVAGREEAMRHFGVRFEAVSVPRMQLATFAKGRRYCQPGVTYMVRTTKHVQLVRDGIVIDQGGPRVFCQHWGRRKFVTHVTRILTL